MLVAVTAMLAAMLGASPAPAVVDTVVLGTGVDLNVFDEDIFEDEDEEIDIDRERFGFVQKLRSTIRYGGLFRI